MVYREYRVRPRSADRREMILNSHHGRSTRRSLNEDQVPVPREMNAPGHEMCVDEGSQETGASPPRRACRHSTRAPVRAKDFISARYRCVGEKCKAFSHRSTHGAARASVRRICHRVDAGG